VRNVQLAGGAVVILGAGLILTACGASEPRPEPSASTPAPSVSSSPSVSYDDVTLLIAAPNLGVSLPTEELSGVIEVEGGCVTLDGEPLAFPVDSSLEPSGAIVTLGATLQIGQDISDTLAWDLEPIEGIRYPRPTDTIAFAGLEHCDLAYDDVIIVRNLSQSE